jgi:hypothetical protein
VETTVVNDGRPPDPSGCEADSGGKVGPALAGRTLAATMSEGQLIQAIEDTMTAAHLKCQPLLLQLAQLWFPDRVPPTVTQSYVTSAPIGGNAMVRGVGVSIKPAA